MALSTSKQNSCSFTYIIASEDKIIPSVNIILLAKHCNQQPIAVNQIRLCQIYLNKHFGSHTILPNLFTLDELFTKASKVNLLILLVNIVNCIRNKYSLMEIDLTSVVTTEVKSVSTCEMPKS